MTRERRAAPTHRVYQITANRAFLDESQRRIGEKGPIFILRQYADFKTRNPGEEAEKLVKSGCFSVGLIEVNPPDAEARESVRAKADKMNQEYANTPHGKRMIAIQQKAREEAIAYEKSMGVENPVDPSTPRGREPFAPLGTGETKVDVTGAYYPPEGTPETRWDVRMSSDIRGEVEGALRAGSTSVHLDVVEWGPSDWEAASAGKWEELKPSVEETAEDQGKNLPRKLG